MADKPLAQLQPKVAAKIEQLIGSYPDFLQELIAHSAEAAVLGWAYNNTQHTATDIADLIKDDSTLGKPKCAAPWVGKQLGVKNVTEVLALCDQIAQDLEPALSPDAVQGQAPSALVDIALIKECANPANETWLAQIKAWHQTAQRLQPKNERIKGILGQAANVVAGEAQVITRETFEGIDLLEQEMKALVTNGKALQAFGRWYEFRKDLTPADQETLSAIFTAGKQYALDIIGAMGDVRIDADITDLWEQDRADQTERMKRIVAACEGLASIPKIRQQYADGKYGFSGKIYTFVNDPEANTFFIYKSQDGADRTDILFVRDKKPVLTLLTEEDTAALENALQSALERQAAAMLPAQAAPSRAG